MSYFGLFLFSDDSLQPPQTVAETLPSSSAPVVSGHAKKHQTFSSTSQHAFVHNQERPQNCLDGSTNDDLTQYPDDYTLQKWQKVKKLFTA